MYLWVGVQSVPPHCLGHEGADQPLLGHDAVPGHVVLLGQRLLVLLLGAQFGRIALLQKGAHFGAEFLVLGRKVEVHGDISWAGASLRALFSALLETTNIGPAAALPRCGPPRAPIPTGPFRRCAKATPEEPLDDPPAQLQCPSLPWRRSPAGRGPDRRGYRRCLPDIVVLQEIDVGRARSDGVDQAHRLAQRLRMAFRFNAAVKVEEELYGDAILTAMPERLIKAGPLPGYPRIPQLEPRGALWVAIEIAPGKEIQVINTTWGWFPASSSCRPRPWREPSGWAIPPGAIP